MEALSRKLYAYGQHSGLSENRGGMDSLSGDKPNDIEIVCMSEVVQSYAEGIERRIHRMGYKVDLLFPTVNVPLHHVFTNIARRGAKFAIVVLPHHEMILSFNLVQLVGGNTELNNISIDQGLEYISVRLPKPKRELPKDIVTKLAYLKLGKPLTIKEIDVLIRFIVGRRENSLQQEYGENVPRHLQNPPIGPDFDPELKATKETIKRGVMEIFDIAKQIPDPPAANITDQALKNVIDSLNAAGPNFLQSLRAKPGQQSQSSTINDDMFSRR
eukprot:TRINITY_DN27939_c0_g1_i1.p1 TRINITY_DN27939_c0_g1~~TRINITY_DN27939_c0_g1_i1.p1  ORF type:complete len:272 (-),score=66.61 TRINITY_DN27939_c0_g1_i1:100-915(-)